VHLKLSRSSRPPAWRRSVGEVRSKGRGDRDAASHERGWQQGADRVTLPLILLIAVEIEKGLVRRGLIYSFSDRM
jgi:hypothetical protein